MNILTLFSKYAAIQLGVYDALVGVRIEHWVAGQQSPPRAVQGPVQLIDKICAKDVVDSD